MKAALISELKKLAKKGSSLSYISRKLNLPKSTCYYHCKDFLKGKISPLNIIGSEEDIGEFVGIFAGDGNFYYDPLRWNYRISISTNKIDKSYAKYIEHLLLRIYDCNSYTYVGSSVLITSVKKKGIYNHLREFLNWKELDKTGTITLKNKIALYSPSFLKGFVRGLIDTDGTIDRCKGRVSLSTISYPLGLSFINALKVLGFNSYLSSRNRKNRRKLYTIFIPRRELERFIEIINLSHHSKRILLNKIIAPARI